MDRSTFSVYVAGAATPACADRVAAAIAALRAAGFIVTCTWPDVIAKVGNANPRDASALERREWSVQDLTEADDADALWFLVPEPPVVTRGAWVEAGYAYERSKHLVFSGDTRQSVFCALGHEFETDEAALAHLKRIRDQRRIDAGLTELRRQSQWPDEPAPRDFDLSDQQKE